MNNPIVLTAIFFLVFSLPISSISFAEGESFPDLQKPPLYLQAPDILPQELLIGPNYRIEPKVENDGFVNIYRLTTDHGPLTVESTGLLRERINELAALKHMEELEKTQVFIDALKEGAKAPFKTVKGLVTEPVDTVTGIGTGIGRWFSDVGRSIVSDDPHQDNVLKTALGYAAVKRKFAYEYGIDPYTTYEPVKEALSRVAQAGFGGGLTPKVAFSAINKPVGTALQISSQADGMKKLVRDKSPAELEDINEEKLKNMGVPASLINEFLKNYYFNPQERTILIGELDAMKGVENRGEFISAAVGATERAVARYMRMRVQMMGAYHANVAPAARIVVVNRTPYLQRKDGALIGLFPLDHVSWTITLFGKVNEAEKAVQQVIGVTAKELWLEGTVSASAREALESRGWKVVENVGGKLEKNKSP